MVAVPMLWRRPRRWRRLPLPASPSSRRSECAVVVGGEDDELPSKILRIWSTIKRSTASDVWLLMLLYVVSRHHLYDGIFYIWAERIDFFSNQY